MASSAGQSEEGRVKMGRGFAAASRKLVAVELAIRKSGGTEDRSDSSGGGKLP